MSNHVQEPRHAERVRASRRLGLLDSPREDAFDRLTRLACRILDAPVAVVAVTNEDRLYLKSSYGLPAERAAPRYISQCDTLCQFVVDEERTLIVPDTLQNEQTRGTPLVEERGVRAYLGIPLTLQDGLTIGTFCVVDYKPRDWSEIDIQFTEDLAASVMTEIELRRATIQVEEHAEATERERAFKARLLDSTAEGIYGVDTNGFCQFINRAGAAMLGYEPDEVVGRDMHDLVHHSGPDGAPLPWDECQIPTFDAGDQPVQLGEQTLWRKDGTPITVEFTASPLVEGEMMGGTVISFRDVSQRKQAEEDIRFYKHAVNAVGQSVVAADMDRRIVYANPASEQVLGWRSDDVLGKDIRDIVPAVELRDQSTKIGTEVRNTGKPWSGEFLLRRSDGETFPALVTVAPILDDAGNTAGTIGVYADLSEIKAAEQRVHFYKHVVDSVGQAVIITDLSGRITYWNKSAERIYGWTSDEVLGRLITDVTPAEDSRHLAEEIFETLLSGETWSGEFTVRRRDGTTLPAYVTDAPIRNDKGNLIGIIGLSTDISATKETERELRFHKHIVDAVGQAVVVSDVEGRISYWNRAAEEIYGWTSDEALGQLVYELLPVKESQDESRRITELLASGQTWAGEASVRRRDGSQFPAYFTDAPIFAEDGAIIGIIGVSHDISDRKEYERQIQYHKLMVDAVGQAVMATDQRLIITYWNQAAEELYGRSADDVLGTHILDLLPPSSAGRYHLYNAIEEVSRNDVWSGEIIINHQDGSEIAVLANAAPIVDNDGEQVGLIAAMADITERKLMEIALRESNRRIVQILESMGDGFLSLDSDWTISYVNRQAEHLLGRDRDELVGANFKDAFPEADQHLFVERYRDAISSGESVSFTDYYAPVSMWFEVHAYPAGGNLSIFFRDVTERREAEIAILNAEERYRTLVEQLPAITYIADAEDTDKILYVSPQIKDATGYTPEEWISDPYAWIDHLHPDDRDLALGINSGESPDSTSRGLEYRIRVKSGEYLWVRDTMSLVRDEHGNPRYWQGIAFDVTSEKDAERAIHDSERRYRTLVEQLPAMTYIASPEDVGSIQYASPQLIEVLGYSQEEWTADPGSWLQLVHPDDVERVRMQDHISNETGNSFTLEYRVRARDGSYIWVRETARLIHDEDGEPRYWQGFSFDVTAEKDAERSIRESEQRFRSLFDNHPDAVFSIDGDGHVLTANPAFVSLTGHDVEWPENLRFVDLVVPEDRERVNLHFSQTNSGKPQEFHAAIINPSGERTQLSVTSIPIIVDDEIAGIHVVAQDVTIHQQLEKQLAHQAFHDSLTGLPNRSLFQSRLEQRLAEAKKNFSRFAVLFFDLDDFKVINDSLGHSAGDDLLVEVARRMQKCIRSKDLLARLGGDEFTLLLERVHSEKDAVVIAERIASVLEDSFDIGGHEVFATVSIGIALGDQNAASADDILRNADLAMYEAKNSGKNRFALFNPSMNSKAWRRLTLETEIRRALNREEFVLQYQPIVDLNTGDLEGVEALVRWDHPNRGLLPPGEFIPVAEQSGLILPLGRWIIDQATSQVRDWQDCSLDHHQFRLNLNLSSKQYQHPRMIEDLTRTLARVSLDPSLITLEITESIAMDDPVSAVETLHRLKDVGVSLALDDFGTGFSALSYLRRFPIDVIKVDRSFVDGLGTDAEDTGIVEAVVAAALAMKLQIIAEGVETEEQLEILRQLGCHFVQGYLISEPLSAQSLQQMIEDGTFAWRDRIASLSSQ